MFENMSTSRATSPYAAALGPRLHELHPVLQQYFSGVPAGHVGIGEGEFTRAGTPRRRLWPFLRPLEARGVAFAGWGTHVPFHVENRVTDGVAHGVREFRLSARTFTMLDEVRHAGGARVTDTLGRGGVIAAVFDTHVQDGILLLRSVSVGLRLGPIRIRAPWFFRPTITVRERFDDEVGRQHVEARITAPIIGRVYEYAGWFDYRIVAEEKS